MQRPLRAIHSCASFCCWQLPAGQGVIVPAPALTQSADGSTATKTGAKFLREVAWADNGVWLKADTHIHTTFSDGSYTVDKLVDEAVRFECDVIAITDHGDRNLTAATPDYVQAIRSARESHSDRIILAGLEWNVPPWKGREHAVVLLSPESDESRILAQFKAHYDDFEREMNSMPDVEQALQWLENQADSAGDGPLVIYEHPNRKRTDVNEFTHELRILRARSNRLIGFSGAPGHQNAAALGAYHGSLQTIDRWDPAAADLDGTWNTLLREGFDVWAAYAPEM